MEDTSKSKIDEVSHAFTVEGISDGIDADSFSVSGTTILGSQSVVLSSIIKALSPIDSDESLELTLTLSPEFIEINNLIAANLINLYNLIIFGFSIFFYKNSFMLSIILLINLIVYLSSYKILKK